MRMMTFMAAIAAVAGCAGAAQAQETTFKGFRVEGKAGYDRFMANGRHDGSFAYGVTGGWDGTINDKFLVGPFASYLWSDGGTCEPGVVGGRVCTHSSREVSGGVRAGFMATPQLLAYGEGGYAQDRQHRFFNAPAGQQSFNDRYHTDGYFVGGGLEYGLGQHLYVSSEYRYVNYHASDSRQRVLGGVGIRF